MEISLNSLVGTIVEIMGKPLVGTCLKMCPNKEIKWREKNKLLHKFEILPGTECEPKADPNRIVKQFTRSAAGKLEQSKEELRPSDVLLMTMNYLIHDIIIMDSVPFIEIYDFINDRVQAIRQDITIQMIEDKNAVQIYEKCVKFYVVSSYILCEEPQNKFDQHLNSKQLSICLEKVMELYKNLQSETMNEIISIHLSLNMTHYEKFYRSGDLYKGSDNTLLKLTIETCISWIEGNFIRFFKAVQNLPLILQMCFFHQFGSIRKRTLKTLSVGFSSASSHFPVETLSYWLCLSYQDTLEICQMYKIKMENKKIIFSKKDFDANVMEPKLQKENFIESNLKNIKLADIINSKKCTRKE